MAMWNNQMVIHKTWIEYGVQNKNKHVLTYRLLLYNETNLMILMVETKKCFEFILET
jgi:hypothetical protein